MSHYSVLLDQALHSNMRLQDLGYRYSGVSDAQTMALGSYLEASFTHPVTHRRVSVAYFPEATQPGSREALCVHVVKNSQEKNSGAFLLEDYLKHKGAESRWLEALALSARNGSPSQKLEAVLDVISELFRTNLSGVISGHEWVQVPMDWGDFK